MRTLKWADADYLKTYSIPLVAGRNLAPSDTAREFLVNETFLKRLGITDPQQALNKEVDLWGQMKFNIVGVVKDFNAMSLRQALVPVLITSVKDFYGGRYQTAGQGYTRHDEERWKLSGTKYTRLCIRRAVPRCQDRQFLYAGTENVDLYKIFAALAIFPELPQVVRACLVHGPAESEKWVSGAGRFG